MSVEFARTGRYSDLDLQASDTAVAVFTPQKDAAPLVTVALDYVARRRVRSGDDSAVQRLEGGLALTRFALVARDQGGRP